MLASLLPTTHYTLLTTHLSGTRRMPGEWLLWQTPQHVTRPVGPHHHCISLLCGTLPLDPSWQAARPGGSPRGVVGRCASRHTSGPPSNFCVRAIRQCPNFLCLVLRGVWRGRQRCNHLQLQRERVYNPVPAQRPYRDLRRQPGMLYLLYMLY